jgi:YggT family protein
VIEALALFIQILAIILWIAILLRVLFSWIGFDPSNPLHSVIHEITEPILAPIRQIMPRIGMFDLSPIIAMFILGFIVQASMRIE